MNFLDVTLHIANFLAPALVVGLVATFFSKLLWRRELAGSAWQRVAAWAVVASALALVVGIVVEGRDGTMSTYAGMVVACAAAIWWTAFRSAPTVKGKGGREG